MNLSAYLKLDDEKMHKMRSEMASRRRKAAFWSDHRKTSKKYAKLAVQALTVGAMSSKIRALLILVGKGMPWEM